MLDDFHTWGSNILTSRFLFFAQVIDVSQKTTNRVPTTKAKAENEEQEQEWGGIVENAEGNTQQKAGRKQKKRNQKRHAAAQARLSQISPENAFAVLPDEDEDGKIYTKLGACPFS